MGELHYGLFQYMRLIKPYSVFSSGVESTHTYVIRDNTEIELRLYYISSIFCTLTFKNRASYI